MYGGGRGICVGFCFTLISVWVDNVKSKEHLLYSGWIIDGFNEETACIWLVVRTSDVPWKFAFRQSSHQRSGCVNVWVNVDGGIYLLENRQATDWSNGALLGIKNIVKYDRSHTWLAVRPGCLHVCWFFISRYLIISRTRLLIHGE